MTCSKLFCFWFSVYVVEYSKNKQKDIPIKNWLSIILIPILSVVILNGIFCIIWFKSQTDDKLLDFRYWFTCT